MQCGSVLRKLLIIQSIISVFLLLSGFEKNTENEITFIIYSMSLSMNNKDPEGYIQTLSDFFIKETYGDKAYIREHIREFGQVIEIEFQIKEKNTNMAIVQYKLLHINIDQEHTNFYGDMILIRTKKGWKVHFVEEKMVSKNTLEGKNMGIKLI